MARNIRLQARVTEAEYEAVLCYSKMLGMSMSDLIIAGTQHYIDLLLKQRQGLVNVYVDANGYAAPGYNKNFDGVVKWQISPGTRETNLHVPATPVRT